MLGVSPSTVRYHTRFVEVETVHRCDGKKSQAEIVSLPPSEDFAYFIGVFAGDGCLYKGPRTYQLMISCDSRYPELIETYKGLLERLTGRKANTKMHKNSGCIEVYAAGIHLDALLGLPSGRKTENGFTVPEWIFENPTYTALFMRGMVETDGGIYKRKRPDKGRTWECIFTAYNEVILQAFLRGAELLGYPFHRNGRRACLSNTGKVRAFMELCGITKCCDYETAQSNTK